MTDMNSSWAAAVIDCEGWVGLSNATRNDKNLYSPAVGVGNTKKRLLVELKKRTGIGKISFVPRKPPAKNMWFWVVQKRVEVDYLLTQVLRFLVLKQEQANLLLSLPPLNSRNAAAREAINKEIKRLNKRGR